MENREMKAQGRESYETLRQLSEELGDFCHDLENQLASLEHQTEALQSSFDGDIYNTFSDKISERIASVREKIRALQGIRKKLEEKADELDASSKALRALGLDI